MDRLELDGRHVFWPQTRAAAYPSPFREPRLPPPVVRAIFVTSAAWASLQEASRRKMGRTMRQAVGTFCAILSGRRSPRWLSSRARPRRAWS